KPVRDLEAPFRTKSGETRIGLASVEIIDFGGQKCALFVIHDITDYKKAQEAVRLSEERYRTIFETTGSPTVIFDQEGTIVLVNNQFEKRTGLKKEQVEGQMKWIDFVAPEDKDRMLEYDRLRFEDSLNAPRDYEARLVTGPDGEIRDAMMSVATIPGSSLGVVSMLDITERRRSEEQLRYLSLHDSLTGLYNRTYFGEEMRRLDAGRYDPVSMVIFDVDGLKLVNDTLGHKAGDDLLVAAANVIKGCFRDSDVVARVGGDEFAALLSRTAEDMVYRATERVRKAIDNHNLTGPSVPLSISMGYAVRVDPSMDLEQLFKDADNNMYKTKSHNSRLARTAIVKSLMDSLSAKSIYITRHEQQMEYLAVRMAQEVGLPNKNVEEIKLLAKYHDIGLVGIPDSIIIKPDVLDDKEMSEAHRHCEIGHRIAQSTPDLAVIADWILKHHEWWNGEGYPLGLKGLEIPVESRIIAICDAYDAMTSDRPYRLTVSPEEAVAELMRCSGTQFDPTLVPIFVNIVDEIRASKE
ncbi:MAG: diguanylate cyclase, partial [Candidatus Saccharibacteria bacterium]